MRKVYYLLLLLLAVAIVVPSCTEKPVDDPQEQPTPDPDPDPDPDPEPDPDPKPEAAFEITVTDKTELSYTIDIIPADKDMTYFYLTETGKNLADLGLETPEDIIAYDLQMIIAEAEAYEVTVEELVTDYYINVGDIYALTIQGIPPGEEFVVYAYGVEMVEGMPKPITELVMLRDTTVASTPVEQPMAITVDVKGTNVDLLFDPLDYTGRYFAFLEPVSSLVQSENPTEEELEAAAMDVWYTLLSTYLRFGFSLDAVMRDFTYEGEQTSSESLDAKTTYMAVAVPVAENGVIYGYPTIKTFTTDDVEMSENVLTLSVRDIKPRSVTMVVETTTEDPYLVALLTKQYFVDMTDEEIIDYYLTNYGGDMVISGDLEFPMTGIEPNTEYLMVAFGYQGGVVTTQLYTHEFATPEEIKSDMSVKINYIGHFDVNEVIALSADYADREGYDAMLTWEVVTEPKAAAVYRAAYKSAAAANVDDESLKQTLLAGQPKSARVVNFVAYDTEYVCCAVAVDENGNVSDLYRTEPISVTYETRGEAQDFLNYISSSPSQASIESLVIGLPAEKVCMPVVR
ncbi:MAG: hypothetical protein J6V59_03000 [Alistipes sp.]|nr:hypothetical protein [Alistipes sp.]